MNGQAKIAIATEDGAHVSQHFGRAPHFEVLTFENGKLVARERRAKAFPQGPHDHPHHITNGQDTHASGMLDAIKDCQVVIAGGMGGPAFAAIQSAGLTPILTDEQDIDRVEQSYIDGTLVNHPERMH
jgi:predicted Fe-Mo cluster-binding NifX family protein